MDDLLTKILTIPVTVVRKRLVVVSLTVVSLTITGLSVVDRRVWVRVHTIP